MTSFNPFNWDNSSSIISSPVLNMVLKDHRGETLAINDSAEEVEIIIPQEIRSDVSISSFVKPSFGGEMRYQKTSITYIKGARVTLTVSAIHSM